MDKNKINRICFIILGCLALIKVEGQNLDKHRWQNRILIFKTTDAKNAKYQRQLKEFKNSFAGLRERKIILYQIIGSRYQLIDYEQRNQHNIWQDVKMVNNRIIDKLTDFEVILIGLDGGIKLKQTELLSEQGLYKIIDRMPVRLEELRNKQRQRN